jgi:hypothetical protein
VTAVCLVQIDLNKHALIQSERFITEYFLISLYIKESWGAEKGILYEYEEDGLNIEVQLLVHVHEEQKFLL